MDYRVVWTRGAVANLADIADYIRRDSPYYASVVVVKIRAAARSLKRFPYRAPIMKEAVDQLIREILIYDYRLIYEIHDSEPKRVEILMLAHSSRMIGLENVRSN